MAKLLAPDSSASATVEGVTYEANPDCSVEVPDHLVDHFIPHGFRPWVDPAPEEEDEPAVDDEFSTMKRNDLFAWLKKAGVSVGTPIKYAGLRAACRAAKAKAKAEEDAPLKAEETRAAAPAVEDAKNASPAPQEPAEEPKASPEAAQEPREPSEGSTGPAEAAEPPTDAPAQS